MLLVSYLVKAEGPQTQGWPLPDPLDCFEAPCWPFWIFEVLKEGIIESKLQPCGPRHSPLVHRLYLRNVTLPAKHCMPHCYTSCNHACNATPPAMPHRLQQCNPCNAALPTTPHRLQHLQCRTACDVASFATPQFLQHRTTCNVAPLAKSNVRVWKGVYCLPLGFSVLPSTFNTKEFYQKSRQQRRDGKINGGKRERKKIMSEIVVTNVIASQPLERLPT